MASRHYQQHALSRRLTLYIVLSSSLITFFAIAFLLFRQYESDVDKLDQRLNAIKLSSIPSIESSLWEFNDQQVQTIIDSLMNLDDVVRVEVQAYTWDGREKRLLAKQSHKKPEGNNLFEKVFPIVRNNEGEAVELGTLTITASLVQLRKNLWQQALYIFITQGIKTFIITSLILLILQKLVMRHLQNISRHTASLRLNNGHNTLQLDRPRHARGDELDQVVDTINDMHLTLIEEQKRELSLQKEKAFAEANAQAKSELLAHMSHEIRTPLNGIIGLLELIDGNNLNSEQKKHLKTIQQSSYSLIDIINDILDQSKLDANKVSINQEHFSVQHLIHECSNLYTAAASKKNIHIIEDVDPSLKHLFVGDALRIKQILLNLMSNAVKYTENGEILIKVERSSNNQSKNNTSSLRFSVRDSGIGIAEHNRQRIFEAFEQGVKNKDLHGAGLGLSISKNLCKLMGGEMGLNSRLHTGSEFWFTLPLEESDIDQKQQGDTQKEEEPSTQVQDLSNIITTDILVVEDNAVNQQVIESLLEKLGLRAHIVGNGEDAVNVIKHEKDQYRIILMDCEMPVMDGFQASQNIRQMEASHSKPTSIIISLSAYNDQQYHDKCKQAGMDLLLNKPVTLKQLENTLLKAHDIMEQG